MSNLRITPITTKKKKQDELRITPILTEEEKKQQAMSQSKVMAPKPSNEKFAMNMTQNNISNQISKNIVNGGMQNSIHNMTMKQAGRTSLDKNIDLSGKSVMGKTTPATKEGLEQTQNSLMSDEELRKKKNELEKELRNYDRKEKVKWWDSDKGLGTNTKNVLYKTFVENQNNKYVEDKNYDYLLKRKNMAEEELENRFVERESQNMNTLDKIDYTFNGNIERSLRGIDSTIYKITGQDVPNNRDSVNMRLSDEAIRQSSGAERVGLDILGSGARMLPQLIATGGTGSEAAGLVVGFANYGGDAYNEAKKMGATEEQATKYGLTIGSLEMGLEKLLGGMESIYGKSVMGKTTNKIMNKVVTNPTFRKILTNASGEFTEEYLQEFLEPIVRNIILEEDNGADFWNSENLSEGLKRLSSQLFNRQNLYAGTLGAMTSASMSTPSAISERMSIKNETNNIKKTINNQNVDQNITSLLNKGYDFETSIDIVNKALSEKGMQQIDKNSLMNSVKQSEKVQNNPVEQRNINNNINNQVNENVQNSTARTQNNNKVNPPISTTFLNSAKENNYNSNSEVIRNANSIMLKRGIEGRFDSKFFTNNSENALWRKDENGKRSVIFNPNADENAIFQNVVIHEMVHDVLSSKNSADVLNVEDILDFVSKTSGYESARMNLEETYSKVYDRNSDQFKEMVDEEVIATVLGNKLGSQEYINRLNGQKPNLARRIYNWIVNKLDSLSKAFGHQSEKAYWRDVANRFEKAFNGEYNSDLNDNTKYSTGKLVSGEDVVISDDINGARPDKKVAEQTLKRMLGIQYVNKSNNNKISIENKDIKKYLNDGYNNHKNAKLKKRIAGNYGEVIEFAKINSSQPNYKNTNRGKQGFDYYDVNLAYPIKDSNGNILDYKYYESRLVVRKDKNNNFAYDLDKFTEKKGAALDKSSLSITTGNPVSSSSSSNNVPQSNKNVKSGTSTKYSMQTKENNTQELDNSSFSNDLSYQGTNHSGVKAYGKKITVDNMYKQIDNLAENNKKNGEALNVINSVKNNPNAKISIYRATPGNNINVGDWVFLTETEADRFSRAIITKRRKIGYKVLKMEVKAKDVDWTGKNLEFVFNPQEQNNYEAIDITNDDIRYSQKSQTWDEFVENNFKSSGTRTKFSEIKAPINPNAITNQNKVKPPIAKEYQKNTIDEKIEKSNIPDVLKISGDNLIEQSSNLTNDDIAKILTEEPETENTKNKRKLAILGAQLLDKGLVFENLSLKTKNRDLMGKWDYTLTSEARGQNVIGNGHYEFDSETKTKKQTSKSLYDIQKEVNNSGNTKEFYEYLYHKHNIDRMSLQDKYGIDNKPVFGDNIDAEYSKNIVNEYEENYPQFTDYAQDIYDYLNADRQELVKSGVITQELADYWQEMYPHYVPIRREDTFGNAIDVPLDTKRTSVNAPIKKAKGGNQNILPLFDTIAKRTLQTYKAVAKNNFGIELKNTLNSSIDTVDTNVDDVINNIDFQDELLTKGKNGSNPTFTVFENGKKVTFEITKDMYDALKPVSESSILSKTFKPLNKGMSIYRGILTEYNPVFMLTNSIKDAQDVLINSQHSAKTYKNIPEAYKQILSKGYWYQEYVSNGGEQNSYFDNWKNKFVKDEQNILGRIVKWPFKKVSQANNVIEMAPRLAEYIASRQEGRSIETSMLDAARVTTNFKAGGDTTKFINRNGGIFLNASVQGLMQNVRNVREARANGLKGWTNLATKCIIAGIPALILNNMFWDDDDDYNELADYVKDNYYIIAKYGDGKFIRIPKGRTIAVIQNAFTQIADSTTGKDEVDLDRFLNLATSNLSPNNPVENNIFSPIIQVLSNKTWYGEDLVPQRLQSSPNKQQYDETTDSFSKWLGNKLNISPYKIHYLLDQYSGGVGDVVLPMMTPKAENGSDSIGGKVISPLIDKFTTDSVMNNKYVGDFYDVKDKATQKAHSIDATEKDILMSKYLNSKNFYLNQLYAEKRTIQNSKLKDSEKYKKVREKQDEINKLAKQSIDEYKKVKINGSLATVGDITYRKDKNGEWTKVKDK